MAVGDMMFAGSIGRAIRRHPDRPFAGVAGTLARADVAVGNLECVISKRGRPEDKRYTFRAPLATTGVLADAGFDVVSLANNHAADFGLSSLVDTMDRLSDRGLAYMGAGLDARQAHHATIVRQNGLTIAFLGYVEPIYESVLGWEAGWRSPGVAIARRQAIAADVRAARDRADVVVVMLHAGHESRRVPSPMQRRLANVALEAGAALVVGAHPHVLQRTRRGPGTLVAYSLGNFIFAPVARFSRLTAIMDVTLTVDGVVDVRWVPVVMDDGFPRPAGPNAARRIMAMLEP